MKVRDKHDGGDKHNARVILVCNRDVWDVWVQVWFISAQVDSRADTEGAMTKTKIVQE